MYTQIELNLSFLKWTKANVIDPVFAEMLRCKPPFKRNIQLEIFHENTNESG